MSGEGAGGAKMGLKQLSKYCKPTGQSVFPLTLQNATVHQGQELVPRKYKVVCRQRGGRKG